MQYLANVVYLIAIAATLPFWLYKSLTTGKYREGMLSRLLGAPPAVDPSRRVLWIHAVSVGEVLLLGPLLKRICAEKPSLQIVLSVTTSAGLQIARNKYPTIASFYSPLDFSWAVERLVRRLNPQLLLLTELELWPNLLQIARQHSVPVAVINARMSEKSFRGYRRFHFLLRPAFDAIAWWGVQSETFAARIRQLASPEALVTVTGSMKFDGAVANRNNPKTMALRDLLHYQPRDIVLVAGSTSSPEEEVILAAFVKLRLSHPNLRLLLVPRHPERFDEVANLILAQGLPLARRSQIAEPLAEASEVVLLDTMGELSAAWGLADLGYVGGSLECGRGGQSMIEPAAYGVPTCFGPETWNCEETVQKLLALNAAIQFHSRSELFAILEGWLHDMAEAQAMGARAQSFIGSQQGSVERTWLALEGLLPKDSAKVAAIPA